MARRLSEPNQYGGTTDHTDEIKALLLKAGEAAESDNNQLAIEIFLAAELLESHDQTGISLDDWATARRFVEHHLGSEILPNLV